MNPAEVRREKRFVILHVSGQCYSNNDDKARDGGQLITQLQNQTLATCFAPALSTHLTKSNQESNLVSTAVHAYADPGTKVQVNIQGYNTKGFACAMTVAGYLVDLTVPLSLQ